MRIDEIISGREGPVFSLEFFPPKSADGERGLRETLLDLARLEPAFASVTYGAGGSTRERTVGVARWLREEVGVESMAHLTCVGSTVRELRDTLRELTDAGIENVLALRGDPPAGSESFSPAVGGLRYASELAALIASEYPQTIGAACFPEGHPEARSKRAGASGGDALRPSAAELVHLRDKVRAGASFLITQLFFDNSRYFEFVAAARGVGIEVPIVPGIMPITSAAQIETVTRMCGASIPEALHAQLRLRAEDSEATIELGVAYATLQCAELLARGAPGIHFYTLNRSPATRAILSALRLHRPWESSATLTSTSRLPLAGSVV